MTIPRLLARLARQQDQLAVTMRMIARADAARVPEANASVRLVQEIVSAHYGFTVEQLIGSRRTDDFVLARHMAIAIAAELLPQRISPLARAFCRTHDLVPFAIAAMTARRAQKPAVEADYQVLRSRCAAALAPVQAAA
jgi:chromosomal replication initiation ATPase DnaA